jgi:hypothetical protein
MTDVTKSTYKQYGLGIQASALYEPSGSHIFTTCAAPPQGVICQVLYGDNDPNWKAKLKRGDGVVTYLGGSDLRGNSNSLFSGRHVITNAIHGTKITRRFWGDAFTLCDLPSHPGNLAVMHADNTAKMAFIKKALAAQQSLQGLVVLGELRETLNLIRDPLKALRQECDRLTDIAWRKRRRFEKKYKSEKYKPQLKELMADTYLSWAFGAQPLVSDVISGAQAAARIMAYHPPQVFVSGRGSSLEACSLKAGSISGNGIYVNPTVQVSSAVEVKYYGSVWTQVPGLNNTSGQLGIRLMDVIPAVWELIPYSFLVDYFTNAQEIVNAACFPTTSIRWAARGEVKVTSNQLVKAELGYYGGLGFGDVIEENSLAVGTSASVDRTEKVRYNYGDAGWIPNLEFQIPGLFSKKWLNVAALAATGRRFNGTNRL